MADKPVAPNQGEPADVQRAGGIAPEPQPRRRDLAYATDRHIDDLRAQRDRLEAACLGHAGEISRLSDQIIRLTARNAQLEEANRHLADDLESERFQRGFVGILATAMTAIGGSLVGMWTGWRQWAMGSLLFLGCAFLLYNSSLNLSAELRQRGILGILKQLWYGSQIRGPRPNPQN